MWVTFIFLVVGIALLILAVIGTFKNWDDFLAILYFWGIALTFIGLLSVILSKKEIQAETAKEILLKGNPYEMVIQYELEDSLYVPIDTVFYEVN